jgi:cell division septation protein DedD
MSEASNSEQTTSGNLEFSLDHRQVVFLFFGLAVVGCFVFGLGMMAGHRLETGRGDEVAANDAADPALAAVVREKQEAKAGSEEVAAAEKDENPKTPDHLEFRDGLAAPPVAAIPATRPAHIAPSATRSPEARADRTAAEKEVKPAEKAVALASKTAKKPAAAAQKAASVPTPSANVGKFTLVIKTFTDKSEAQALAGLLRTKGYASKVDAVTEKGKPAFRVRIGDYGTWDEGLAAKTNFEKAEKRIAWLTGAKAR